MLLAVVEEEVADGYRLRAATGEVSAGQELSAAGKAPAGRVIGCSRKDDRSKDKVSLRRYIRYLIFTMQVYAEGADSVMPSPFQSFSCSLYSLAFAFASPHSEANL